MIETPNGNAMAVRDERRAIATGAPQNPWADLELLKPHGGNQRPARVESLATISAGYKNQQGMPVVSRDGTIHITDEGQPAPGLREALVERGCKALTIAVGSDDPSEVIQQSLKSYSRTRLEAWGDHEQITLIKIKPGQQVKQGAVMETERETVWKAEDPKRYAQLASTMKAETFFYFYLARWLHNGDPEVYMPDGWGSYRLRFTSLNSAEAIRNQLRFIASKTGGKVAGIPLELFITYRNLAGPDGVRRNVPIWTLVLQPPDELRLNTADSIQGILTKGIAQAEALSLPKPIIETIEQAMLTAPDIDLEAPDVIEGESYAVSHDDARIMRGGGPIANFDRFKVEYFLAAGNSSLRSDEGRRDFLLHHTGGRTGSLREFAQLYTSHDGEKLLEAVNARAILEREASDAPPAPRPQTVAPKGRGYADIFPDDDALLEAPKPKAQPISRKAVPTATTQAAVALTGGPTAVPVAADEDDYVPVDEEQYQADLLAELARDGQLP